MGTLGSISIYVSADLHWSNFYETPAKASVSVASSKALQWTVVKSTSAKLPPEGWTAPSIFALSLI